MGMVVFPVYVNAVVGARVASLVALIRSIGGGDGDGGLAVASSSGSHNPNDASSRRFLPSISGGVMRTVFCCGMVVVVVVGIDDGLVQPAGGRLGRDNGWRWILFHNFTLCS